MRCIIRVIVEQTTDDEAIKIKKEIQKALKDYKNVSVELSTMG
jgi:methyl coenzyme M reductase beta subunit